MIQSSLFSAYLPNSRLWEQILIVFVVIWSQLEPSGHHPAPALLELSCFGGWCRLCRDPLALATAPSRRNSVGQERDPGCRQGMEGSVLVNERTQQPQHRWGSGHRGTRAEKMPLLLPQPSVTRAVPFLGVPSAPQHRIHRIRAAAGAEFWVNGIGNSTGNPTRTPRIGKPQCWVFPSVPC